MNWIVAAFFATLSFTMPLPDVHPRTQADAMHAAAGAVVGDVLADVSGTPLGGALITVQGPDVSVVTPASGGFGLGNIPAGTYRVRFAAEGYHPIVVEDVEVRDGEETRLVMVMIPRSD